MKKNVLNLYAGIGGNRKLWPDVNVTAIEYDPGIAQIYQDFFPDDTVIITNAHQYLSDHYDDNWDFIWSSPPCPTHSQIRYNLGVKNRGTKAVYPDMKLYQEIIFLKYYVKGKWVVENTVAFYDPLIQPQTVGRHWLWSNYHITPFDIGNRNHRDGTVETLQEKKQLDISKHDIINKRQILRNCVEPELSLHIFNCAFKLKQSTLKIKKADSRSWDNHVLSAQDLDCD